MKEKRKQQPPALTPDIERSQYLRLALEFYQIMAEQGPLDWPDRDAVRKLATAMGVPYLFLMLESESRINPPRLRLEDIAEWTADPEAQRVLAEWWASTPRAESSEEVA